MASHTLEAEGMDVVLVGSLNPAILHPEWFLAQNLVSVAEAKESKVELVSPEFTNIRLPGIRVTCVPDRLVVATKDPVRYERMLDFLLGIVGLLPHTPIRACGINSYVHYLLDDRNYWHRIGHVLAPKVLVWNSLFSNPGLQSLAIKAPKTDGRPGEYNITIQPSAQVTPGIFVNTNTHMPVAANDSEPIGMAPVEQFLQVEWKTACELAKRVAETIFEQIPPTDG